MTRARKGKGRSLTWLSDRVRNETGVSLTGGRRLNWLETTDIDFVSTGAKHRQTILAFAQRQAEKRPGRPMVVISHDGTDSPEVWMDVKTLALLLSWAVKGNEAHWARPWMPRKDTDEG